MKTMIRSAAGLLAASLVGVSTSCGPNPVVVHDVYHYDTYDHYDGYRQAPARYGNAPSYGNAASYYGNAASSAGSSAARSFVPVENF